MTTNWLKLVSIAWIAEEEMPVNKLWGTQIFPFNTMENYRILKHVTLDCTITNC